MLAVLVRSRIELHARPRAGRRAEALVLLSDIEAESGRLERSIQLRREALEAAAGQPTLLVEIHKWLGSFARFTEGEAAGDRHAAAALELAEAVGDDSLRAGALSVLAFGRFRAGSPGGLSLVEQTVQLATSAGDPRQRLEINFMAVNPLVWAYQLDRARSLLQSIDREWRERDEPAKAYVLWWLGMIELRCGRFPLAADYAERSREIERQYMIGDREEPDVWLVALIAAHRGELDLARSLTESNRPLTDTHAIGRSGDEGVLGLVELWSGRPDEAAARFAVADADRRGIGVNEPAMFWWRADYAEALLEMGKADEAAALVDAWEAEAQRLDRSAVLAEMTRCRGLVAAARGDLDDALAELEQAVAQHEVVGDLFGRARALLALGTVRRRARQKRAAREAITAAVEGFEACGAVGWAERARGELGTIGGRTRIEGLTPAEGRIAALVAEGRTNREVAAALFLTEHTVATALTRVYRKLGVRSRTELARLAQTQDADLAKT